MKQCGVLNTSLRIKGLSGRWRKFRDALFSCDLHDLGLCGLPFTWDSGRSGGANVRVRLDRVVADPTWRDLFSNAKVHHLISSRSDHSPILVELCKDIWDRRGQNMFMYEVMWERVDCLSAEIRKQWCLVPRKENLRDIVKSLNTMQIGMLHWSKQ
jgi:hypothetical protein